MRSKDAVTTIARQACPEWATIKNVVSKGQLVLLIALCVMAGWARADNPGVIYVSTQPFTCTLGLTGICTPQNPGPLRVNAGENFKIYVIRARAPDLDGNGGGIFEIDYAIGICVRKATELDFVCVDQIPNPPGPVRSVTFSFVEAGVYHILFSDGLGVGSVNVSVDAAPTPVPALSDWALIALSLLVPMAALGRPLRYRLRRRLETR